MQSWETIPKTLARPVLVNMKAEMLLEKFRAIDQGGRERMRMGSVQASVMRMKKRKNTALSRGPSEIQLL